jgi:transposase
MPRSLSIRKPKTPEIRQLHQLLTGALNGCQRRRVEAILLYAVGLEAVAIAAALKVHPNTIYADLHAFGQHGVNAVHQLCAPGAPARISEAQRAEIVRLAKQPPIDLGFPYGRWSLAKLQAYLLRHRLVKAISREHLRRLLKKGACACGAFAAS